VTALHRQEQGIVRLGVDFGVSMTVIAVSDPDHGCHIMEFPGLSRRFPGGVDNSPVHGIPCLIQYDNGKSIRFGDAVARAGTGNLPTTARWMRRYLCDKSSAQIVAGKDQVVSYEDATAEYLGEVLTHALQQFPGAELVFTLPAGAPAEYPELLNRIARDAGSSNCSWIYEFPSIAAGYGYQPATREPFLIIAFSETGIEVTIIMPDDQLTESCHGGMRVLAHATGTTGCQAIDSWIVQDIFQKFRLLESDPCAVRLAPHLQYEAGRVRELLSNTEEQPISLTDTISGKTFVTRYTIADLNRVLTSKEVFSALQDCIARALSAFRKRGADTDQIQNILLLGAGCALPSVLQAINLKFPTSTIHAAHPHDAIARGAAIYAVPRKAQNRIASSYALRYWDTTTQEHHYRFLIHSGTRYPSIGQVARIVISAAYDGQTHLGIPIYEIGGTACEPETKIELVSDPGGGVRLAGPVQDKGTNRKAVHANERSPTLLIATPPARKGEPRFECTFTIDSDRNLCLSARDLVTGSLVKVNTPVHRLT
jgi:molecular chaperone DnaK